MINNRAIWALFAKGGEKYEANVIGRIGHDALRVAV